MKRLYIILAVIMLLIMTAGCQPKTDEENENQIDGQLLSINNCYVPVKITVTGCKAFENMTDIVYATDITGDGIIGEVSSCAEFVNFFGGSYNIRAENSRNARYFISLTEAQDKPVELGMNYYYVILKATFQKADHVEIQCDSDITVKGLVGEFELLVLASDNEKWNLGDKVNRISGIADNQTDIVLTCSEDGYLLTSTAPLHGISITGSGTINNEYIEITSDTNIIANNYVFSYSGNEYSITTKKS